MEKKIKIYGFNNGGEPNYYIAGAISEDGNIIASHMCSCESFMADDLGMSKDSKRKHDIYDKRFGEGNWETEFVSSRDMPIHKGLNKALELHRALREASN